MEHFQHPKAIVESSNIGQNTRIWAFAHILPKSIIGEDCNICDHVFIENDVVIGNRVTIKCGVQIWDGIRIEDDVFIGPNATFTNDIFPRSKQYPSEFSKTIIHAGASIGANATILPGIEIGRKAMVGAGTVVTKNVPAYAIVVGNPAFIKGYDFSDSRGSAHTLPSSFNEHTEITGVGRVLTIELPFFADMRGDLSVIEFEKILPFVPKRSFWILDVPGHNVRGEHAHRDLHQFLICVSGSCAVTVDDGKNREEVTLDKPNKGIYIPPMIWVTEYNFTNNAVLLVIASEVYCAEDYIRDYENFLKEIGSK